MSDISSVNINTKWLDDIYDNLLKIKKHLRFAKNGADSLDDYIKRLLIEQRFDLIDLQYTNLKLLVTEIAILLDDLAPIINGDSKIDIELFDEIKSRIDNRNTFIEDTYDTVNKKIIRSNIKKAFVETVKALEKIRGQIIIELKEILYMKDDNKHKTKARPEV